MLRVESTLPAETEQLITQVIGLCIEVHRVLGPGLLESTYVRAVCIELGAAKVSHERERLIAITYKCVPLARYRLDLVVADQLVLEIKCVERLQPLHRAQLLAYLRAAKIRAGLLVNFNVEVLREGIKRVVL